MSTWATQAQPHSRGRAMRTETLHMTLAFLGSVEKEIADELIDATPATACSPAPSPSTATASSPALAFSGPAPRRPRIRSRPAMTACGCGCQPSASCRPPSRSAPTSRCCATSSATTHPPTPPPLTWHYDRMVLVASESTDGGSRYRVVARSKPQPG
ncbi:2'-5' RNA ligase family protein [Achromobacter xylosoxidans]